MKLSVEWDIYMEIAAIREQGQRECVPTFTLGSDVAKSLTFCEMLCSTNLRVTRSQQSH